ncbi:MAG: AAA family ATPase [Defluviitaleaceae bacterium]|nr:AAA family ATPase [Defluviitaleaceae bacterium]
MSDVKCSIYGHAFNRRFYYTDENGVYRDFIVPGGALFLQKLLSSKGMADNIEICNSYRCEHIELKEIESKERKEKCYSMRENKGFTSGDTIISPSESDDFAVIWDEGLGKLVIPQNTKIFWASNKRLPEAKDFSSVADKCILMLDVKVFRDADAKISKQISWERSAFELIRELTYNSSFSYLLKAKAMWITFAEDGAVYAHFNKANDDYNFYLYLTHGGFEGTLRENNGNGKDDAFAVMAASAITVAPFMWGIKTKPDTWTKHSILHTVNDYMTKDYSIDEIQNSSYRISDVSYRREKESITLQIPEIEDEKINNWSLLNLGSERKNMDAAFSYALKGENDKNSVFEVFPKLRFGKFTTIDRKEIESFQNIRKLMIDYVNEDTTTKPLSIAVFGSPGSGKSFGVKEIAKDINPGKIEILEFNLSQFKTHDLNSAFQEVRDAALQGKMPLVFFDEFDADDLKWLKYFLMPMQDGKFRDVKGDRPIGKSIFVFAGGVSESFKDFIKPTLSSSESENEREREERKKFGLVKGPDFVSRLKGTVDILGPNSKGGNDLFVWRRAVLLRSIVKHWIGKEFGEETAKKIKDLPVSRKIIYAMLKVPKFKYGVRSMEAILDMSTLKGEDKWIPSTLPEKSQLLIHVVPDDFMELVNNCPYTD